jgi:hypothetical protein
MQPERHTEEKDRMKVGVITLMAAMLLALPALAGPPDCPLGGSGGDSDSDGIQLSCDNCSAAANANQEDTDGDGCGNRCDPDFNQDGVVAAADFSRLASNFGSLVPPASPNLDIGPEPLDNVVAAADFSNLAANFGGVPGPSGTTSGTTTCP